MDATCHHKLPLMESQRSPYCVQHKTQLFKNILFSADENPADFCSSPFDENKDKERFGVINTIWSNVNPEQNPHEAWSDGGGVF